MDEMEMSVNLKAIRWAWLYTVLFLFAWTVYDFITTGDLNIAFFLLTSQNLIYTGLNQYFKWKLGKDEK